MTDDGKELLTKVRGSGGLHKAMLFLSDYLPGADIVCNHAQPSCFAWISAKTLNAYLCLL